MDLRRPSTAALARCGSCCSASACCRVVDDAGMMADVFELAPRLLPMMASFTIVEKADLWRYLILYWLGGVYLDWDVQCITPFDQWQVRTDWLLSLAVSTISTMCCWGLLIIWCYST